MNDLTIPFLAADIVIAATYLTCWARTRWTPIKEDTP